MSKKVREMTQDNPTGNEFTYLDQSEWGDHWLLSRLISGSGIDGDFAYFWPEQADISSEDLKLIEFQLNEPGGDWVECASAEGDFFPSQGNVQAVAGAYAQLLFSTKPGTKYRALVPRDLISKLG
jgi:hypothetical protein